MNPETLAWLERAVLLYVEDCPLHIQSFLEANRVTIVKPRLLATEEHCDRWLAHQVVWTE